MITKPCAREDCDRVLVFGKRTGRPPEGLHRHRGRGHCCRCYKRATTADTLIDTARRIHSRDEVFDEWVRMRGQMTRREFAAWMGKTYAAFDRMWWRARAAGDERARELGELVST